MPASPRPDHRACSGCDLCLLPCPVWQETRDPALTLAHRMRGAQGGAGSEDLRPAVDACVLCGACEPVCPERIDTLRFTLGQRRASGAAPARWRHDPVPAQRVALLADAALRADPALLARVERRLEAPFTVDAGPLVAALEAGHEPDISMIVEIFGRAGELVLGDGLLLAPLRRALGKRPILGLGEALLRAPALRGGLRPRDFYVIEPRAYHFDFERMVRFYDRLRRERGVELNLDLQRTAMPTGGREGGLDSGSLIREMMAGRKVERIVLESARERAAFAAAAPGVPVLHLVEVAA